MKTWYSVPLWLKEVERNEAWQWTPERDAIAEMMAEHFGERPSGISGIDPHYFRVKAYLVALGRKSLEIIAKRGGR